MSKRKIESDSQVEQEAKKAVPAILKPIDMMEWIENNKDSFTPPMCYKLMYGDGQLKVIIVGGPNSRKDYHIEEGEELFFQIKGDLLLKVIEKGKPKDVLIKEGEIFCLPSRIHHSPQHFENTVGLVIERERVGNEYDGLRYFSEDGVSVLWEKWFQCEDLDTQVAPIIKEFLESEAFKTGKPDPNNICDELPLKVDNETELQPPFSLKKWLKENKEDYENGSKAIFNKGEFKVHAHGAGEQTGFSEGETWLWQMEGDASVVIDDFTRKLDKNKVVIIPAGSQFKVIRERDSVGLSVITDPEANK